MNVWLVLLCVLCQAVVVLGRDRPTRVVELSAAPMELRDVRGELTLKLVQIDGRVAVVVRVAVPVVSGLLRLETVRAVGVDGDIVTGVSFGGIVDGGEAGVSIVEMRVECFGRLGSAEFGIEARVDATDVVYGARIRVIVGGIHVLFGGRVVSGAWRKGLGLRGFDSWLGGVQLALRLRLQGFGGVAGSQAQRQVAVRVLGKYRDAVEESDCGVLGGVAQFGDGADTLLARGQHDFKLVKAKMSKGCGVAVSEDGAWLVLRFVPYRVSGYNFRVQVVWDGDGAQDLAVGPGFPTWVDLNLSFDRQKVPPVVVRGFEATLDVFGNELLRVPVVNSFQPPQRRDLGADDFLLRLTTEEGEIYSVGAVGSEGGEEPAREREIWFVTPTLADKRSRIVNAEILYEILSGGVRNGDVGNLTMVSPISVRAENVQAAVVEPGETLSLQFAGAELASTESCDQDEQAFRNDRFVVVELEVPFYDQTSFSQHKRLQVEAFLRDQFEWSLPDGIRLVEVIAGKISFAVLVPRNVSQAEMDSDVSTFLETVSDEDASFALGLPGDALTKNCRVVEQLLCDAFPAFEVVSRGNISGFRLRLLPLWIALAFFGAVAIVIAVVVAMFWRNKGLKFASPAGQSRIDDYDPDVESQDSSSFCPAKHIFRSSRDAEFMLRTPVGVYPGEDNDIAIDVIRQHSRPMQHQLSEYNSSADDGVARSHSLTNSLYGLVRLVLHRDRKPGGPRRNSEAFTEVVFSDDTPLDRGDRVWESDWPNGTGPDQGLGSEHVYDQRYSDQMERVAYSPERGFPPAHRAMSFVYPRDAPAPLGVRVMTRDGEFNVLDNTSHSDFNFRREISGDEEVENAVVEYLVKAAMDLSGGDNHGNPQSLTRKTKMESELRAHFRDLVTEKKTGNPKRTPPIAAKTVDDAVMEYIQESLREVQGSNSVSGRSIDVDLADSIFELIRATSGEAHGDEEVIDQQSSSTDLAHSAAELRSRADTQSSQRGSSNRTLLGLSCSHPTFPGVRRDGTKRYKALLLEEHPDSQDMSAWNGMRRISPSLQKQGNRSFKSASHAGHGQVTQGNHSTDNVAEVPWHNSSQDRPVVKYEIPPHHITRAVGRSVEEERHAQRTKRATSFMQNGKPSPGTTGNWSSGSRNAEQAVHGSIEPKSDSVVSRPLSDRDTSRIARRNPSFSFPDAQLLVTRNANSARDQMRGSVHPPVEAMIADNANGASGEQGDKDGTEMGAGSTLITRELRSQTGQRAYAVAPSLATDPPSEKPFDSESSIEEVL